jgi:nitroreductase
MDAHQVLITTRSVRKRLDLDRPVPRSVILDCIDLACQAPTGGNVERCRWIVIDDPDQRRRVADIYRRAYGPYMEERKALLGDATGPEADATRRVMSSSDHLAEVLDRVPAMVIPCRFDRPPVDDARNLASFYGSILPAAWSFMLALRSKGLGSAWTTLHLDFEGEAAELLGVPPTVTQVALLPVAYTVGDGFKPAPRRPAAGITYWNHWGNKGGEA